MKKEQNTETVNLKVTPSLKQAVVKKTTKNSQSIAEYIKNLIRKDLNLN